MFQLEQHRNPMNPEVISMRREGLYKAFLQNIMLCNPSVVIMESAPLYAFPSVEYPQQAINHSASVHAQRATTDLLQIVRGVGLPTHHWVMIDDVNNGAHPGAGIFQEFLAHTAENPLYHRISHLAWEHEFQQDSEDQCGLMDARFQLSKLREATRHFTELNALPLLVNIHPIVFQNQQRLMLESLRALLKSDPDACVLQLSRSTKSRLALDPFIHVWTDDNGIASITTPQLIGGSICHIDI